MGVFWLAVSHSSKWEAIKRRTDHRLLFKPAAEDTPEVRRTKEELGGVVNEIVKRKPIDPFIERTTEAVAEAWRGPPETKHKRHHSNRYI